MTTDVWITQVYFKKLFKWFLIFNFYLEMFKVWYDYRFVWNPSEYNNIHVFNMPVSEIWVFIYLL